MANSDGPSVLELPDWISDLKPISGYADFLSEFAASPQEKVIDWVTDTLGKWLVSGFTTVVGYILYSLYLPFEVGSDAVMTIARSLFDGIWPAANAIILTVQTVNESVATAVSGAGIAAPVVVWGMVVLEVMVVLWLLDWAWRNAKPVILSFNPL